jgi:hypothetical protein
MGLFGTGGGFLIRRRGACRRKPTDLPATNRFSCSVLVDCSSRKCPESIPHRLDALASTVSTDGWLNRVRSSERTAPGVASSRVPASFTVVRRRLLPSSAYAHHAAKGIRTVPMILFITTHRNQFLHTIRSFFIVVCQRFSLCVRLIHGFWCPFGVRLAVESFDASRRSSTQAYRLPGTKAYRFTMLV